MSHSLTTYGCLSDLHSALVADHTLVSDLLILTAVTFPILCGSEDPLAEKTVCLRLQGSVVDGLGLLHLTV